MAKGRRSSQLTPRGWVGPREVKSVVPRLTRPEMEFADLLASGESPQEAVRVACGTSVAAGQRADKAVEFLGKPAVGMYLVAKLRPYVRSWEEIEETCRAVLARALAGEEADGTPLELSPEKLEAMRLDAAKTGLAALAKSAPDTFAARAREEDAAAFTQRQLAVRLLGPDLHEGEAVDEAGVC